MGEESPVRPSAAAGASLRRAPTVDENSSLRRRGSTKRLSAQDTPSGPGVRRRSSTFSDYSIREARKSFQSSTDDLLHPHPPTTIPQSKEESSPWHSLPLAFALLPALGGMIWTNGSSVITDIMLLGLAAIFLNWSVRVPWTWYHSAQALRKIEEYNSDSMMSEDSEDDNALSFSKDTLEEVPEDEPAQPSPQPVRRLPAHEHATKELYFHELLALASCFVLPVCGAYLLHTIRSQLTRPSEGLVSNYNLTIFLLAAEIRPMAHLVKLIQARTLHLQRVANMNPYDTVDGQAIGDVKELTRRLEDLEARNAITETSKTQPEPPLNNKQSAAITIEVRKTIQPDFDALNRAVRRYEKRATLQAFQTDSRIHELEARLNDAISLAAAAANNSQKDHAFTGIVLEWAASAVVLPLQALGALLSFPFKIMGVIVSFGKERIVGTRTVEKGKKLAANGNGRFTSNGRPQRSLKK